MASKWDGASAEERAVLDRGLPPLDQKSFMRQQLGGGDFTRWKEANQAPVLALMPDGTGYAGPAWSAEMERRRIGREMALERAMQTRGNLNDPIAALAYGAATAWGWDPDRLSDVGMLLSPLQYSPENLLGRSRGTGNRIAPSPPANRSAPARSGTPGYRSPAAQRPPVAPKPQLKTYTASKGWTATSRASFMDRARRTIADDPSHPLRFLIDPKTGAWRGRSHLSEEPGVQAGHMVSRHSGAPETFAVEDAFFNQVSNWRGETQGAVFEKPAVEVGGIPVEGRTASMWQRLGMIP